MLQVAVPWGWVGGWGAVLLLLAAAWVAEVQLLLLLALALLPLLLLVHCQSPPPQILPPSGRPRLYRPLQLPAW